MEDSTFNNYGDEEELNFWPVYSDMALSTLIIMLLFLLAQFVINTKLVSGGSLTVIKNQNKVRNEFIVSEPSDDQVHYREGIADIQRDGNLQLITFSSDIIFGINQSGWKDLSHIGQKLLSDFGRVIAQNQKVITRIQIEGHASWEESHNFSDSTQYNQYNWQLSANRAMTVALACIKNGVVPAKLSYAGRAHYVPLKAGENYKNSPKPSINRRINVLLIYSQEYAGDSPLLR